MTTGNNIALIYIALFACSTIWIYFSVVPEVKHAVKYGKPSKRLEMYKSWSPGSMDVFGLGILFVVITLIIGYFATD